LNRLLRPDKRWEVSGLRGTVEAVVEFRVLGDVGVSVTV